jgi:hypothetical protein
MVSEVVGILSALVYSKVEDWKLLELKKSIKTRVT